MKLQSALLLIVAFLLSSHVGTAAFGAMIGTATLVKDPANGIPFGPPDQALGAPWVSYVLGLQSTAGELIQAVSVRINGPLHQRWIDSDSDGDFESTAASSNMANGDSHLWTPLCFDICALEDNSGVGSPLVDTPLYNYGVGTMLQGAWSFVNVLTSTNVAYLVIPKGSEANLDIRIQVANPLGEIIGNLTTADFFVPEPPSVALCSIALAGFACVARRRFGLARSTFPTRRTQQWSYRQFAGRGQ